MAAKAKLDGKATEDAAEPSCMAMATCNKKACAGMSCAPAKRRKQLQTCVVGDRKLLCMSCAKRRKQLQMSGQ